LLNSTTCAIHFEICEMNRNCFMVAALVTLLLMGSASVVEAVELQVQLEYGVVHNSRPFTVSGSPTLDCQGKVVATQSGDDYLYGLLAQTPGGLDEFEAWCKAFTGSVGTPGYSEVEEVEFVPGLWYIGIGCKYADWSGDYYLYIDGSPIINFPQEN